MLLTRGLPSPARLIIAGSLLAMLLVAVACGETAPDLTTTAIPSPTRPLPPPTTTPVASATPAGAERDAVEEIQANAAEVRELEPLAPVEIRYLTREAAEAYFRQELEEEEGTHLAEAQPVYRLLGFIAPGDDLMELELRLVTSQVLGFYDTDEEAMFLVGQDRELDTLGVIALSHEFVHALQDQHFDLDALLEELEDDWDARLALTALVEGDATLAGTEYMERFVGLADILTIDFAEVERLMGEMGDYPEALQREMTFPYEDGAGFAGALFDEGGWVAIDNSYDAPPATTEQILHPEKYLAGEARQEVVLPDLTPELGEGWRIEASNTLGELLLSNYLGVQLSRAEAARASAGWGGDRWAFYSDAAAGELLLLVVEWDAPGELHEFFAAYLDWLDARSGGALEVLGDDAALWDGEGQSIYVSRQGGRATVIVSTDREALGRARRALGLP